MDNCTISIGIGIITYLLLQINKLYNLNSEINKNSTNYKCISNYNISLIIPFVISLIYYLLLSNIKIINDKLVLKNNIKNIIKNIMSDVIENLDIYTDNVQYWF